MKPPALKSSLTLLWIGLGVLLLLLLVAAVVRRRGSKLDTADPQPKAETPGPAPRSPSELQSEAARLAAAGRYGEAVHALLLQAISILSAGQDPPRSRTSRELVSHFPLDQSPREAFATIVSTVERFLFGGRAIGREDYEACAERVRVLTGSRR